MSTAAPKSAMPRAKLRNLVLFGALALALLILIYGAAGSGEDPQASYARAQQIEAAEAKQGDREATKRQLESQSQAMRDELERAKREATARVQAKQVDDYRKNMGATLEQPIDLNDADAVAIDPVARQVSDYKQRKAGAQEASEVAHRQRLRQRIVAAEWGDDAEASILRERASPQGLATGAQAEADPLQKRMMEASLRQMEQIGSGKSPETNAPSRHAAQEWLQAQGKEESEPPTRPRRARSPFLLYKYDILPCVLTRDIVSDLPGVAECRITRDIYDSITGSHLLIPAGARLRGPYNAETVAGQDVQLAAFTRMIFRNGATLELGPAQGANRAGAAGLPAEVNNHFWQQFGSSFLIAGLSGLLREDKGGGSSIVIQPSGQGLSSAAGQVLVQVTNQILSRNRSIKPTLSSFAGDRIAVVVARDLEIDPAISRAAAPTYPNYGANRP